jgi:hypothetical protein
MKIYNSIGQQVAMLIDEKLAPGKYNFGWSAGNLTFGVYYVELQNNREKRVKTLQIIK